MIYPPTYYLIPRANTRVYSTSAIYPWLIDPINEMLPYLFVVSIVFACLFAAQWVEIATLASFTAYYGLIFLLVLPENKHLGAFIPSLCVVCGTGLALIVHTLISYRSLSHIGLYLRAKRVFLIAGIFGVAWGLVCLVCYFVACNVREQYITKIKTLPVVSNLEPLRLRTTPSRIDYMEDQIRPGGDQTARTGLLISIRGGKESSLLVCQQMLHNIPFVTRHRVQPLKDQQFFVACVNGPVANYRCAVKMPYEGSFTFTDCKVMDMRGWKEMPICLLYAEGQRIPGAPPILSNEPSGELIDPATFDTVESTLPLSPLVTDMKEHRSGPLADSALRFFTEVPPATLVRDGNEFNLVTPETNNHYVAQSRVLCADRDGEYEFVLEYKLQAGGLAFGALSASTGEWVAQCLTATPKGDHHELRFRVRLKLGDSLAPTISNYNLGLNCKSRATLLKFLIYKLP